MNYQFKKEFEPEKIFFQIPSTFVTSEDTIGSYRLFIPAKEEPVKKVDGKWTIDKPLKLNSKFNIIGAPNIISIELREEDYKWYQYTVYFDAYCPPYYDGLYFRILDGNHDYHHIFIRKSVRRKYRLHFNAKNPTLLSIEWCLYINE